MLYRLGQAELARAIFPLGGLRKDAIRELAREMGMPNADRPDSQEICFIPDGDYAAFVERHHAGTAGSANPFSPGQIVDTEGCVLGRHRGVHRFTVGQRRGLGIAYRSPLYVLEIDAEGNRVVVGERSQLERRRCRVVRPNWISVPDLTGPLRVHAKIRSRHPLAPALIAPAGDGGVDVLFDDPQPAVCPGQACVFYQGDIVVGGGWIARGCNRRRPSHGRLREAANETASGA